MGINSNSHSSNVFTDSEQKAMALSPVAVLTKKMQAE